MFLSVKFLWHWSSLICITPLHCTFGNLINDSDILFKFSIDSVRSRTSLRTPLPCICKVKCTTIIHWYKAILYNLFKQLCITGIQSRITGSRITIYKYFCSCLAECGKRNIIRKWFLKIHFQKWFTSVLRIYVIDLNIRWVRLNNDLISRIVLKI